MPAPLDAKQLDACVAGCAASHQFLLAHLDELPHADFAEPSRLPGWSRLTVVGHLALNAESHAHLFDEASRQHVGDQYPGGPGAREAAIDQVATWSPADAVSRLRSAIYALEGAWARANHDMWVATGRTASGSIVAMHELPFLRWREVVVHLTDLGTGIEWDQWPALYVRIELERQKMAWAASHPMGLTQLPAASLALPPAQRVAWLLQRIEVEGLSKGPGL